MDSCWQLFVNAIKTDATRLSYTRSMEKFGIVHRGTSIEELENFMDSGEIGHGRDSALGNDFVSTSTREYLSRDFMGIANETETSLGSGKYGLGVMIEFDISGLEKNKDWKAVKYKPSPDVQFDRNGIDRLGENWDKASQSVKFAHGAEVYLKPGSKPKIKRVVIPTYALTEERKQNIMDRVKKLGLEDKIELQEHFHDRKSIEKSLQANTSYSKNKVIDKMIKESGIEPESYKAWIKNKLY